MTTQLRFVVALAIAFCALTVAEDAKQPVSPLDVPRAPGIQPLPAKLPEGLTSPTTEKADTNKQKRDTTETPKRPATPAPNRPVIKPAATGPRATDKLSNQQKPQPKPVDHPKETEHTTTATRPKRDTENDDADEKTFPAGQRPQGGLLAFLGSRPLLQGGQGLGILGGLGGGIQGLQGIFGNRVPAVAAAQADPTLASAVISQSTDNSANTQTSTETTATTTESSATQTSDTATQTSTQTVPDAMHELMTEAVPDKSQSTELVQPVIEAVQDSSKVTEKDLSDIVEASETTPKLESSSGRHARDTTSQNGQQKVTPKPVPQKQTKLPVPGSSNHGSTNSRPVRDTTTTGQQKPQTLPGRQPTQKPQTLPARPSQPQKPQTLPARPLPTQKPQKAPAPGQNQGSTNSRPKRDTTNQNGQQKPQPLPAILPTEKPSTQPAQTGLNVNREGLTKPAPLPSNARPARESDKQDGQKTPPPIAILLATEKPQTLPAQTDLNGNREGLTKPAPTPSRPVRDTNTQNGKQKPQPLPAQLPTQKPNTLPAKIPPTAARPARDTATPNGQQKPQPLPARLPTQKPQTLPAQTGNREGPTKPAPIPSNTRPARDTVNQNGQQKPQTLPAHLPTQKPQTLPAQTGNREGLTKPAPIPSNTRPTRDTVNQNGQQKPQPLPVLIATQKPQTTSSGTGVRGSNEGKPTPATVPPKRPVRETQTNKPTTGQQKPQTLPASTPKPTSTATRPADKKPLPNPGHF